jgi:hypothetical protein
MLIKITINNVLNKQAVLGKAVESDLELKLDEGTDLEFEGSISSEED